MLALPLFRLTLVLYGTGYDCTGDQHGKTRRFGRGNLEDVFNSKCLLSDGSSERLGHRHLEGHFSGNPPHLYFCMVSSIYYPPIGYRDRGWSSRRVLERPFQRNTQNKAVSEDAQLYDTPRWMRVIERQGVIEYRRVPSTRPRAQSPRKEGSARQYTKVEAKMMRHKTQDEYTRVVFGSERSRQMQEYKIKRQ
jgi:hypothetical protein